MTDIPPLPDTVATTVAAWPVAAQTAFHALRARIQIAALDVPATGPLLETLKWGEPAWLTQVSKSGTTLRVAWKPVHPDEIGVFVNCRTSLLETIREIYPDAFRYDGTRGLWLRLAQPIPEQAMDHLARLAQGYHRNRR